MKPPIPIRELFPPPTLTLDDCSAWALNRASIYLYRYRGSSGVQASLFQSFLMSSVDGFPVEDRDAILAVCRVLSETCVDQWWRVEGPYISYLKARRRLNSALRRKGLDP